VRPPKSLESSAHSSPRHLRPVGIIALSPSKARPSSIKHNEPFHSRPLACPRLATNTAQSHRPPAHLASALSLPSAQTGSHSTNTSPSPHCPLPQHRKQQYSGSATSHRPRFNPRGRCEIRQGHHRRAQGVAALLRYDLHLQEMPGPLVTSHHKAGLPFWHCPGELPWMQEQASDC